jgi:hypothetical protein
MLPTPQANLFEKPVEHDEAFRKHAAGKTDRLSRI